eukprot:jgi/Galph1/1345/GphlegSOOS_G6113.1
MVKTWEAGLITLSLGVAASIIFYVYYSSGQPKIQVPSQPETAPAKSNKKKKKKKTKNKQKTIPKEEELDRIVAEINGTATPIAAVGPKDVEKTENSNKEPTKPKEKQISSKISKKLEEEIRAAVNVSLASIHETGIANGSREEKVLNCLEQIEDPTTLGPELRFLIAQWCHTVYCTLTAQSSVQNLLRLSLVKTYLLPAWETLEAERCSLTGEEKVRFLALKLDIACRLHQPEKMIQAYHAAVSSMSDSIPSEDKLVLYASAAIMGRPDEVKRIGKQLAAKELEMLHTASMRESSMIDYGALYHLSVRLAEVGRGLGFEVKYEWKAYRVIRAVYRLRKGAGVAPLRPGVGEEWTEQECSENVQLIRTGAIAHYLNPGPVKIPITGFGGPNEMVLFGYVDVTDGTEQVRHTDFYTLKRSSKNKNLWTGKELVTMHALTGPRAGSKVAEGILDVEFTTEPDPDASWKLL